MAKNSITKPERKSNRLNIEKGMRFGKLVVVEEVEPYRSPGGQSHRKFKVQCDCGNSKDVPLGHLTSGKTRSCGCLVADTMSKNMKKHGQSKHPIYRIWDAMKQRCYNPNDRSFMNYGERGIDICEEWQNDFAVFYDWAINNGWKKGLVIDKIDNDKGYSPSNCRFVDYGLSGRNKRLLTVANKSGYRGIYQMGQKWAVKIRSNGDKYYLGVYATAVQAAQAYDKKARELNAGHPTNFN